jgi:hypothetical protein
MHYTTTTHSNQRNLQFLASGMLSHTVRCFPPPSPTQLRHNIMPLCFLIPCSFPTLCPLSSPLLMPFPFYSPHFLPLSRMSLTSLHVSSSIRTMSFPLPFLPLFPITFHSIYLSLTYLYHLSKAFQDTDSLFTTGYSNCP